MGIIYKKQDNEMTVKNMFAFRPLSRCVSVDCCQEVGIKIDRFHWMIF